MTAPDESAVMDDDSAFGIDDPSFESPPDEVSAVEIPAEPVPVPVFEVLFIDDFQEMSGTGRFDLPVLLLMQDAYVQAALNLDTAHALRLMGPIGAGVSLDDRRYADDVVCLQADALRCYDEAKASGGGADLAGYVNMATAYHTLSAAVQGSVLKSLLAVVGAALARGERVDVNALAAPFYAPLARMSSHQAALEALGGVSAGAAVEKQMNGIMNGMASLARAEPDPHEPLSVGGLLLAAVDRVATNPDHYLDLEPAPVQVAKPGWGFDPASREADAPGL